MRVSEGTHGVPAFTEIRPFAGHSLDGEMFVGNAAMQLVSSLSSQGRPRVSSAVQSTPSWSNLNDQQIIQMHQCRYLDSQGITATSTTPAPDDLQGTGLDGKAKTRQ